jgi:hypothetical protein
MGKRITRAPEARKFIGKEVRWWPLHGHSGWAETDVLREVAGRNVRIGHDWRWLPDIYLEPAHAHALPGPDAGEGQP